MSDGLRRCLGCNDPLGDARTCARCSARVRSAAGLELRHCTEAELRALVDRGREAGIELHRRQVASGGGS